MSSNHFMINVDTAMYHTLWALCPPQAQISFSHIGRKDNCLAKYVLDHNEGR